MRDCEQCGARLARDNPGSRCTAHSTARTPGAHDDPTAATVLAECGDWPAQSCGARARLMEHAVILGIRLSDSQAGALIDRYDDPIAAVRGMAELAARLGVRLGRAPVCHGYQNGCACVRCDDRAGRVQVLRDAGQVSPRRVAALAKRDSEERFAA